MQKWCRQPLWIGTEGGELGLGARAGRDAETMLSCAISIFYLARQKIFFLNLIHSLHILRYIKSLPFCPHSCKYDFFCFMNELRVTTDKLAFKMLMNYAIQIS